jgi:hypothetical protein
MHVHLFNMYNARIQSPHTHALIMTHLFLAASCARLMHMDAYFGFDQKLRTRERAHLGRAC